MQSAKIYLDSWLNHIHLWNQPQQNPMKRMFQTRGAGIACAVVESSVVIFQVLGVCLQAGKDLVVLGAKVALLVFPESARLQFAKRPVFVKEHFKKQGEQCYKWLAGFICTFVLGIVFSPEANFKFHVSQGLIADHLAEKIKKEREGRLQLEQQKQAIEEARAARFAQLEAKQQAAKQAELEALEVDSRLAELLLGQ